MQQHGDGLRGGTSGAVRLESFGGPAALAVQDVPVPQAARPVRGKAVIDLRPR
jgi:hypothetical protein